MESWKKTANAKEFFTRIVNSKGNPSTKDAEECGVPFSYWFDLCMKFSCEKLEKNAREILAKI